MPVTGPRGDATGAKEAGYMERQTQEQPEPALRDASQGTRSDRVDVADAMAGAGVPAGVGAVVEPAVRQEPNVPNVPNVPHAPRMRRTAAEALVDRLSSIEVGDGTAHERMVVFPVFAVGGSGGAPALVYRTLEQAIADGSVEVTEQASATVPELTMRNKGATMVFILDGEEIIGGQQNRIVNASFLVGGDSTVPLPVTCVEHGRWHSTSRAFSSGESSYHSLRGEKYAQVSDSLRRRGSHTSDQSAVWSSVERKAMLAGAASPTGAMHEIYASRGQSLTGYLAAFPYVDGAIGFAVALGGVMAGADLFDAPATAAALWPKLLRSYAMDALDSGDGGAVERERAARLFERARGGRAETFPSIALGEDVRVEGDGVIGGGLVYDEVPVHITLFRTHDASASQPDRMTSSSQRRDAYLRRAQQRPHEDNQTE
jgi:hypothetical protein